MHRLTDLKQHAKLRSSPSRLSQAPAAPALHTTLSHPCSCAELAKQAAAGAEEDCRVGCRRCEGVLQVKAHLQQQDTVDAAHHQ